MEFKRVFTPEIPSDFTVLVCGTSFSLHKFPLVSKCGFIRKLVASESDANTGTGTAVSAIELRNVPGGAETFELAAKFCYGINFEMGMENIAALRCVAEYLEMTEEYAVGNLVERTDSYLNEVALKTLAGAVLILRNSEKLLPMAEEVKLVSRCVDTIAYVACKDVQFGSPNSGNGVDWWADDLTLLGIEFFRRVLIAMVGRGFKEVALGPLVMLYAQKSFRGLEISGKGSKKKMDAKQEHEKRVVLETIVSLLPKEKNVISVSFLSMLLRAAIYLDSTIACRLDLEKRMGLQLGQAALDDILIPSFSSYEDTLFDVDTVQRIVINFFDYDIKDKRSHEDSRCPPSSEMERVGKLLENYLAEIASDRNLTESRFIAFSELIPEEARVTEDGMYRAIDIFLKTHPSLSDMERKKLCSIMNCQKLSREACAHAAQNDRLPAQTVVQVLYHEQRRFREVLNSEIPTLHPRSNLFDTGGSHQVPDELLRLRRENQELKFELVKLKTRLKELAEKPITDRSDLVTSSPINMPSPSGKPPLPRKSFMNAVSKKFGKLYPFSGALGLTSSKGRAKPSKDRRHSIS